ncbi:hypothetical protein B0H13DRAFT_2007145 [Mycena leptocephala]|nr:hypothetical protein B0H13DRAFT_2007145 [Mycena leptocephala]
MNNSNPFAPPGESSYDLWVERSNFNSVVLAGVGYGILFTLTAQTLLAFLQLPREKIPWRWVVYVTVMFILASLGLAGDAKFNQMTWIDDRNFPGGPNAFTVAFYSTPVDMMAFIACIIMSWMADGLVLWRFTVISGNNYRLAIFPGLMYLGSIASSIALIVTIIKPGNSFWTAKSVQFGIAYWSLSISLNIILTVSIVTTIFFVRRRMKAFGSPHSRQYVSIAAMLVESAALYAIWSLVFIICYARNSPLQNILLPPLGQIEGIAPVLILFRVSQGRAWSQSTVLETTQMQSASSTIPLDEGTSKAEGSYVTTQGTLKFNMTINSRQTQDNR